MDIEKAAPVVVEKAAPLQEQAPTPVTSPSKTMNRLLVLALAVVAIALAIGLGVGLSNKHKSEPAKTSKGNSQNSEQYSLELLCSRQDLDACKMACEEAMCCFDETAVDCGIPSQSCGMYAPCFVLTAKDTNTEGGYTLPGGTQDTTGELQEPTAQVQEICNSGYMEVSNITCEEACWEANCCYWTGEESCHDGNAEICDMWKEAGCFVFSDPFGESVSEVTEEQATAGGYTILGGTALEAGEVLEEPDSAVEAICNNGYDAEIGITCEEACIKASCCYWMGEDSCYDDNAEVCDMWKDAGCFAFSDPFGYAGEVP